jgi:hypothetical protein
MIYFNIVRLFIIVWSAVMISAVESVAIRSEGLVELESTNRDAYAKVLTLAVGSFLGDAAFKLRKSNDTDRSKAARGNAKEEESIEV